MRTLVTNAKNRIAYNVVKSLASRGIEVFCADFVPRAMSFYSKNVAGHFIYPSPFSDQERFIACLVDKIRELKIEVLIPVFEELFLVARHKSTLLEHVKMAVPDYSQILIAHNKDVWVKHAETLNIPVPKTIPFTRLLEEPDLIAKLSFPLLVKPRQGGGGWGIKRLNSIDAFRAFMSAGLHENQPWERFVAQEWLDGDTLCVAMVLSQGRLRGKVTYRQVREYPPFGGQATCRVSVSNEAAEAHLQRLLERLGWHGVCQADFLVDRSTQTPYLIDINPRFWGSLAQGIASGVDFPHLVWQIALNGDVAPVDGFREGVVTRWLGGEMRGFYQHYAQAGEKLPFLRKFFFPERSTALFDDFSFGDPVPFFAWGVDALSRAARRQSAITHESLPGVWE